MLEPDDTNEQFYSSIRAQLRSFVLQQDRGSSNLGGSRQGSHVSAYGLLQQLADSLAHVDDLVTIEDEIVSLLNVISMYLNNEETQALFNDYKNFRFNIQSRIDLLESIKKENISEHQKESIDKTISEIKQNHFELFFYHLVSIHLKLRNKIPNTAFPEEFNEPPPRNEGTQVRAALAFFRKLNTSVSPNSSKFDPDFSKKEEYSIELIVKHFTALIWYPKISDEKLYIPESHKNDFEKLGYKRGVEPRNNKIDTLCLMLERHIGLMFTAFNFALNEDNQERIISEFLFYFLSENSSYEHSWKLPENIFNQVLEIVKGNILKIYGIGEESAKASNEEEKPTSSSMDVDEPNKDETQRSKASSASDGVVMNITPPNLESDGSHSSDATYVASEEEATEGNILFSLAVSTRQRSNKQVINLETLEQNRSPYTGEELFVSLGIVGLKNISTRRIS